MSRRRSVLIVSLGVATIAAVSSAVVFGGIMNVAATEPDPALVQWMLSTTMKNSVQNHASEIVVPTGLDLHDPALAQRAFGHYSVACTPCHGAPGVASAPWLVLDPPARSLAETAEEWSDGELYWIVKHGIQMTGMPALGPTHQDPDLWAIAAFVSSATRDEPGAVPDDGRGARSRSRGSWESWDGRIASERGIHRDGSEGRARRSRTCARCHRVECVDAGTRNQERRSQAQKAGETQRPRDRIFSPRTARTRGGAESCAGASRTRAPPLSAQHHAVGVRWRLCRRASRKIRTARPSSGETDDFRRPPQRIDLGPSVAFAVLHLRGPSAAVPPARDPAARSPLCQQV